MWLCRVHRPGHLAQPSVQAGLTGSLRGLSSWVFSIFKIFQGLPGHLLKCLAVLIVIFFSLYWDRTYHIPAHAWNELMPGIPAHAFSFSALLQCVWSCFLYALPLGNCAAQKEVKDRTVSSSWILIYCQLMQTFNYWFWYWEKKKI